jgi:hypothetical protein
MIHLQGNDVIQVYFLISAMKFVFAKYLKILFSGYRQTSRGPAETSTDTTAE